MVEATIEITQFCENMCDFCSTNASPDGEHLEFMHIEAFLYPFLTTNIIERINISGGEPLSHPDFYLIFKLCKEVTDEVWVYTNLLDRIIFNAHVLKEIIIEANLVMIPGRNHYVPKCASRVHLLKAVPHGRAKNIELGNITVSRNFWDIDACADCDHILLQANGRIVTAPCLKDYE